MTLFSNSASAQLQATQTRARIGAAIWGTLLKWSALLWILATFAVIWLQISWHMPQLRHRYFAQWMVFSSADSIPKLNDWLRARGTLKLDDNQYAWADAVSWLNGPEAYHHSFPAFFWHFGGRTGLVCVGLWIVGIAATVIWRHEDGTHIRGPQLLTVRRHNRQLNGGIASRIYRVSRETPTIRSQRPIRIGNSLIPAELEEESFLICGSPGAGKSTLIRSLLHQIQDRKQSAIVIDPDCEFLMEFYDENRGDFVLNPLDARCPYWDPWLELRDESFAMDVEALVSSLIRGLPRNNNEQFFQLSSRTLLESILTIQRGQPISSIADFLTLDRESMHTALQGTAAYPLVDPRAAEQGSGIVASTANAVKSLQHLPTIGPRWSALEWAANPKGWIFLSSTEQGRAAIQTLQGVWLDCLVRQLMSNPIGGQQIWIAADELPSLGYQPQIEKLATRGRKRGLSLVMGFQNVSQLRSLYERDGAITLTSAPSTKIILRTDEFETAEWCSKLLGQHEIERLTTTALTGTSSYREGLNLSPHRTTEQIVSAGQIQTLEKFHGYLAIAGHDRTTVRIPEHHLVARHAAFVPRRNSVNHEPTADAAPEISVPSPERSA